jgi:hypothetical protein
MSRRPKEDLTGRRFGRLVVLSFAEYRGDNAYWNVRCDCGVWKEVWHYSLIGQSARSCGCSRVTHGLSAASEYTSWIIMRHRCLDDKHSDFEDYGGRGIKICRRWMKLKNFISDMGPRPSSAHILDRIDDDGDFEPSNCRWVTRKERARRRRNTLRINVFGITFRIGDLNSIPRGLTKRKADA